MAGTLSQNGVTCVKFSRLGQAVTVGTEKPFNKGKYERSFDIDPSERALRGERRHGAATCAAALARGRGAGELQVALDERELLQRTTEEALARAWPHEEYTYSRREGLPS